MSDEVRPDSEFTPQPVSIEPPSFSGVFFPKARQFAVSGGTFTHITNNPQIRPVVPADFRRIPLGDIDLRRETRVDYKCGIVPFASERWVVRRIYSARINRRRPDMTVALYNAEELYGVTSASGIHAAVFHDDFLHRYRDSHSIIVQASTGQ
ncbi:hypothetical protein K438DRAFT_1764171 [Mycena galopus ATCC 62051]|nr:hypothetical protein K438DRAFT_1764171 [Mycena galopus ATCC 62051]